VKAVKVTIGKKKYYLAYNGTAMFEIQDMYGGLKQLMDLLGENNRKSFDAVCEVTALLAEQGELSRRYYGHDRQDIITSDEIKAIIQPMEIADLITSIHQAASLGYGRELDTDNEDEVDLGLLEINQKKTNI
jgi:hypothetical protein